MEEREPGWNERHGHTLPPPPDNAAIRWGTAFETAVIDLAAQATGWAIADREMFFQKKTESPGPLITCHIDGRYFSPDGECPALHEGKTTSSFMFHNSWGTPGTDHVPQSYYCQAQHQMICTGIGEVIISVLVFPETPEAWEEAGWYTGRVKRKWLLQNDELKLGVDPKKWAHTLAEMGFFRQYSVPAKPSLQAVMIERYKAFWENYVIPGILPEPENYDDIKRLFPEPKKTLVVPDAIERMLSEYAVINKELKGQEKRQEEIKVKALAWAREEAGGVIDDESAEALILRNGSGDKVGSFSKNKNGVLSFRA
jgi:predicted phage-related endonuclease